MIKRLGLLAAAFSVATLGFATGPVFAAGQSTSTVTVKGSVTQSCTTLTPNTGTLQFDAYDSFANKTTPVNYSTPLQFTTSCTKAATGVNFSVDGGKNCQATGVVSGDRAMKSTGTSDILSYQLYQDSPGGTAWPFNTDCSAKAGPTLTIGKSTDTQTLSLYGQIPAGQDPSVATDYQDTVTVAINY